MEAKINAINFFFSYAFFAVHFVVLLFFIWQIHFVKLNKKFLKKLAFWTDDELPKNLLLKGLVFLLGFDIFYAASKTWFQFWAWSNGGLISENLLPPATPISYFIGYTGFRFWLPIIVNLVIAGLFLSVIYYLKVKQRRLFYRGEEYVASIAILAVGWPGIIVYVPLVLVSMLGVSIYNTVSQKSRYTSFLIFWLPIALFVLILGKKIIFALGLRVLFISGS